MRKLGYQTEYFRVLIKKTIKDDFISYCEEFGLAPNKVVEKIIKDWVESQSIQKASL